MAKKDIFSKLKNYNNELEQILDKKGFSSDIKNLLLNMFYKIEVSYKDYQKVKRTAVDKNEFMEKLINIIDKNCNKVEIVEPGSAKGKVLQKYNLHSISDKVYKKIISYPIEEDLLYAIADIQKKYYYISDDHYMEKQIFDKMLNLGYCMNLKEIIRDFSGWSWKIEVKDLENISYNLIYQNIRIMLGDRFLENWQTDSTREIDYIVKLQEKVNHMYGVQNSVEFYPKLFITLAMLQFEKNPKTKEKWLQEKKNIEKELEIIADKVRYLEELTKSKKLMTKQIKKIDEMLNNQVLLDKELKRRKAKEDKRSKILNKQYLRALLNEERRVLVDKLQKATIQMNPRNYVSNKRKLDDKYEKLNTALENVEGGSSKICMVELQKQFLKCMETRAKNVGNKKDLLDLIYHMRYYVQLPVSKEKTIKNLDSLRMQINKIEEILITKCINLKLLNMVSSSNEINYKIIKNVLLSQAIDLENLELAIFNKYNKILVNVYEKEELEDSFEFEVDGSIGRINIRNDRNFKLFIK